ncbi:recombinase family protein [Candidatus Peregrinibacteria bacterium]|nr:MAG: recombinase family protein [Candidatus Peregrinibacteria bacterium]
MGLIQQEKNTLDHLGFSYPWSNYSPTGTAETMKAEMAKGEVTNILTRLIGEEIALEKKGYQVRESNFGYQNEKITLRDGKKYTIQVPHPIEAKWVRKMFELRAEGALTDKEICERVNAMGFQTRERFKRSRQNREVVGSAGKRLLEPKMLEKYIKKQIYCGVRTSKWTHQKPLKCPYEGLVSIETFNAANRGKVFLRELPNGSMEVQYDVKRKIRSKHNPLYPFRFVVRCPFCKKNFKGSASTGKSGETFPAYHCDRAHKNYRVTIDEFHRQVGYYLGEIKFKPQFIQLFEAIVKDTWIRKQKDLVEDSIDVEKHLTNLKERKKAALDKILKLTSPIVLKELEKEVEDLEKQITQASNTRNDLDLKEEELQMYLKFAKRFMEHPGEMLVSTESHEKLMQTWSAVFKELPSYEEILNRTPKLALAFELGQRSEINMELVVIPRRIELRFTG